MKRIILLLLILSGYAHSMEKAHIWQAVTKETAQPQPQITPAPAPQPAPSAQLPARIEPRPRMKKEEANRKLSIKMLELKVYDKPITSADINEIKNLFNAGADANYRSTPDENPLFRIALDSGNVQIVQLFLDNGAHVNQIVRKGKTPLVYYLDQFVPNVRRLMGENYIFSREAQPDINIMAALIRHGADINATDAEGRTPLMMMALAAESEFVRVLLYNMPELLTPQLRKLRTESTSYFSLLPSELIAQSGQYLQGADPNIKDKAGKTALNYAIEGLEAVLNMQQRYIQNFDQIIARYEAIIELLEPITKK